MLDQVGPPDLLSCSQLKVCNAHLWHDREALEAIVWFDHRDVDNPRQSTDHRGGKIKQLIVADLHVYEPFAYIPLLLIDKSINAKIFCPC